MEAILLILLPLALYVVYIVWFGNYNDPSIEQRNQWQAVLQSFKKETFGIEDLNSIDALMYANPGQGVLYFLKGKHHAFCGNFKEAEFHFQWANAHLVGFYESYLYRGYLQYEQLNYEQALLFFNKTIWYSKETCIEAYLLRGLTYLKLGNHLESEKDFAKAIEAGEEYTNYVTHIDTQWLLKKLLLKY